MMYNNKCREEVTTMSKGKKKKSKKLNINWTELIIAGLIDFLVGLAILLVEKLIE